MKYSLHAIVLLLILCGGVSAAPEPEWRCLWVDSWQQGFLTAEQCDQLLADARRYHFNTILVEVRRCADAYYRSALEPRGTNIRDTEFDPLQYLIQKAHQQPRIQVHAWVVVYRAWVSTRQRIPDDRQHVVNRHSEWLIVSRSGDRNAPEGYYLDPALPEVQNYLVAVFRDLIEKYGVDGLHLDYVRYPGSDWGYGRRSLELWRKASGSTGIPSPDDPAWCAWRRDQVTALVRRTYGELATRRPGALLSAATITWGGLEMGYAKSSTMTEAFQDWLSWLQEGILDFACPMNYKRAHYTRQAGDFSEWTRATVRAPGSRAAVIGIAGWLNTTPNIIRQMKEARETGADGVALFSYQSPTKSKQTNEACFSEIARNLFQSNVPVPQATWKEKEGAVFGRLHAGRRGADGTRVQLRPVAAEDRVRETTSDQNGYYLFARLSPDRYRLEAVDNNAKLLGRATFSIEAGQALRRDLRVPDQTP